MNKNCQFYARTKKLCKRQILHFEFLASDLFLYSMKDHCARDNVSHASTS